MGSFDDGMSMIFLGDACRMGHGIKKDAELAMSCYQMAVLQGESFGYECMAQIYLSYGYDADHIKEAYANLSKAEAMNGGLSPMGCYMMGNLYYLGLLGEKDYNKAAEYFESIDDPGDDFYWKARYRRGQIFFLRR